MMEYASPVEERKSLPPGTYDFKENGDIVRVTDDAYEEAARRFREALECLKLN